MILSIESGPSWDLVQAQKLDKWSMFMCGHYVTLSIRCFAVFGVCLVVSIVCVATPLALSPRSEISEQTIVLRSHYNKYLAVTDQGTLDSYLNSKEWGKLIVVPYGNETISLISYSFGEFVIFSFQFAKYSIFIPGLH